MKSFFYCFIVTGIFLGLGFTTPNTNISQKALDAFDKTFENVKDVKWFVVEDGYTAAFEQNDVRTVITYDKNGGFLSSRRYYSKDKLPFNILLQINEKYKGKTIGIITEVVEPHRLMYSIDLEDDENIYVLESSGSNAPLHLEKKIKKQQPGK